MADTGGQGQGPCKSRIQDHSWRRSLLSCGSAGHTAVWQTFREMQTDQAAGNDSTEKKAPEDRACYGPCHIASTWRCLTLNESLMQSGSTKSGRKPEREKAGDEAWAGEMPKTQHRPKGQNRARETGSPALGMASAPRLTGTRAAAAWDSPPLLHKAPGLHLRRLRTELS